METYEIDDYSDLPKWARILMYVVMIPIAVIALVAFLVTAPLSIFKR
jgi:hypothetical protein